MDTVKHWKGWTVDSLIGEGSFGKVYKISRNEYGHTYESALKVIRVPQSAAEVASIKSEGMSDASISAYYQNMIEEIVSEFALMSELRGNSNIVSYEDHEVVKLEDEFGWDIFIRMELLTPLYRYIKDHPLTEKDVVKLGIDICKALEICRKFNIIHRDIKPENIFVSAQGNYKLGDFGISKQLDKATVAMSKKGTYEYMAPEVYRGESYDASVDIYSLGIVLYKFLNGNRTPFMPPASQPIRFQDKDKATVRRMNGEPIPAPCNAQKDLSSIILKACAYDPGARYKDPLEMRKDLEALYPEEFKILVSEDSALNGATVVWDVAQESTSPKRNSKLSRTLILLCSVILVLAGAAIGIHLYNESSNTTVPYVVGEKADKAKSAIESADLICVVEKEFSDEVKRGKVISQSIDKDETVKKGTELTVVISRGVPIPAPDLTIKTLKRAKVVASEVNLKVKVSSEEYSDSIVRGNIIRQSPKEGEPCSENQAIKVVVSKGVKLVEVPDVVGMTPDKARTALTEVGLDIRIEPEPSDKVPTGKIISQSKEAGTLVTHNMTIFVKVSTGAANVSSGD